MAKYTTSLTAYYSGIEDLAINQSLTGLYAAFGELIDMTRYSTPGIYVDYIVNDSEGTTIEVVGLNDDDGDEFTIDGISVVTLADANQRRYFEFDTGTVPRLRIKAKYAANGVVAGTLTIDIDRKQRDVLR